ncbi:hypothetical protein [Glycomyces tarimensis]
MASSSAAVPDDLTAPTQATHGRVTGPPGPVDLVGTDRSAPVPVRSGVHRDRFGIPIR